MSSPCHKGKRELTDQLATRIDAGHHDDAREAVTELMREEGMEVLAVANGVEGLRVIDAFAPDVALVDLGMPLLDGLKFAKRLRERRGCQPALVAYTGFDLDQMRTAASDCGFARFLVKPAPSAVIARALREAAAETPVVGGDTNSGDT